MEILKKVLLRPKSDPNSQTQPLGYWVYLYEDREDAWVGRPTIYGPFGQPGCLYPDEMYDFPKDQWNLEEDSAV